MVQFPAGLGSLYLLKDGQAGPCAHLTLCVHQDPFTRS